jgi:hypothetical protein
VHALGREQNTGLGALGHEGAHGVDELWAGVPGLGLGLVKLVDE